jgi:hypothetical protein
MSFRINKDEEKIVYYNKKEIQKGHSFSLNNFFDANMEHNFLKSWENFRLKTRNDIYSGYLTNNGRRV